jgi:hypothetical protein
MFVIQVVHKNDSLSVTAKTDPAAVTPSLSMDVLNVRFGLRRLLRNPTYHAHMGSVPKSDLTPELEPEFHAQIAAFAEELALMPERLLTDEYSLKDRKADWTALVTRDPKPFESRSRVGHKLLDHHMPHFWEVRSSKGVSVAELACDAEALHKALLLNTQMHSTPYKSEIRKALVLSGGLSTVTKYRAGLAKHLVKRYEATRVLDPCIGWGGRMLGALAAGATYVGCEPDPKTFAGLQGILADIDRPAELYNEPAEVRLPQIASESVDMVLTSPPYYTLELYTGGDQSVKEGMSWETWVATWLRPVVHEALRCLRPGGTSCWSVKNIKIGSRSYPLADVVRDLHEEKGYSLHESFTLKGPGRPGVTKPSEEQTFCYTRRG